MDSRRQNLLIYIYADSRPLCTFQMRGLTWLDWRHAIRMMPLSRPESRRLTFGRWFGCGRACAVLPARTREGDLQAADPSDG